MQVEIKTRHFSLGDEQREKIEAMLEKLERFSPRPPQGMRLNLTHESGRFTADLVFSLKSADFRTRTDAHEPELATDAAVENIRTQLQKHKGKISARQQGAEGGLGRAMGADPTELFDAAGASVHSEGFQLRSLAVEDAMALFQTSAHQFYVFRNDESGRICVLYARENGEVGLLEASDA